MVFKSINVLHSPNPELLDEFAQNFLQEHSDLGWNVDDPGVPDQTQIISAQHIQDPVNERRRGVDQDSGAGSPSQEV